MKCKAPIDPATGIALEGEALEAALRDPYSPRCGQEIEDGDVFCPSCGARILRESGAGGIALADGNGISAKAQSLKAALASVATKAGRLSVSLGGTAKRSFKHAYGALKRTADRMRDCTEDRTSEEAHMDFRCIGRKICKVLSMLAGGLAKTASGILSSADVLIESILVLIAGVWLYGAFLAHGDVEEHQSFGVVLRRMYGTEYNPLTRHGYRMYIKHFTTLDPDKNATSDELGKSLESAANETFEAVGAHVSEQKHPSEAEALYRLRENLADAAGNAASGKGNAKDEAAEAIGNFIAGELIKAIKNDGDGD